MLSALGNQSQPSGETVQCALYTDGKFKRNPAWGAGRREDN